MATYIFNGKVISERANVNISPVSVSLKARDAGFSGEAIVSIACSQISIKLDTTYVAVSLDTMKNYVEYLVRTLVDSYGYLSGRGYDVEITSVVDPNGQQTIFGAGIRDLKRLQMTDHCLSKSFY
jgi:hypothetical protein